ncbi:MAG: four helix bundle protein [Verrucomicrobia bacterium]|nr:four helix bundle protein [Verrucomicrobiota bacterium]
MYKPAQSFRDLIVWQRAHEFVLRTYELTKRFARDEQFCLIPQFRRAAISIPANIAEGFKKRGLADKNRFFNTSQGSLEECRYYLILGNDLGYGDCIALEPASEEVSRLLVGYAKGVARNSSRIIRTDFE